MNRFVFDHRLGIQVPHIEEAWELLNTDEQEAILLEWESIRESIPDRIKELEAKILDRQQQLDREEDFRRSCMLNTEISELASIINDLNLWYRIDQDVSESKIHS